MRAKPSARLAIRAEEITILVGRFSFLPVDKMKETEQSRAEHEKLEQRLSQQREFQGVYQIGDV